ncbi:MAG: hypothetical protein K2J82_10175, partial [Muribaculaceae bacterium]|nr:hypothetical protein [Muribaculaceae bacterium]
MAKIWQKNPFLRIKRGRNSSKLSVSSSFLRKKLRKLSANITLKHVKKFYVNKPQQNLTFVDCIKSQQIADKKSEKYAAE